MKGDECYGSLRIKRFEKKFSHSSLEWRITFVLDVSEALNEL